MECTADGKSERAFGACGLEFFTGGVDSFDFAGDDELSGAVIICTYNSAFDVFADFFDCFVGKSDNCCHC